MFIAVQKYNLLEDRNAEIILFKKFWNFTNHDSKIDIVPYLLIYTELLSSLDERNHEVAKIIYEKHLLRFIK